MPGERGFYAVPEKRNTFHFRRPPPPLTQVVADHKDGGQGSRRDHYLEWARLLCPEAQGPPDEQTAVAHATHLDATCDSFHCHVWTQVGLLELPLHCRTRLGSFEIEAVWRLGMENIVVLRKHGELVVKDGLAGVSPP